METHECAILRHSFRSGHHRGATPRPKRWRKGRGCESTLAHGLALSCSSSLFLPWVESRRGTACLSATPKDHRHLSSRWSSECRATPRFASLSCEWTSLFTRPILREQGCLCVRPLTPLRGPPGPLAHPLIPLARPRTRSSRDFSRRTTALRDRRRCQSSRMATS